MQAGLTIERAPAQASDTWGLVTAANEFEERAYARALDEYHAACDRYEADVPDRDKEFATYGLRYARDREQLIRDTVPAVAVKDYAGEKLTPETYGAIATRAAELVDAFLAWREQKDASFERFVETAEKKHDAAVDRRHNSREALLKTPAPDAAAILTKLEVLLAVFEGEQAADDLAPVVDDARRLLGAA